MADSTLWLHAHGSMNACIIACFMHAYDMLVNFPTGCELFDYGRLRLSYELGEYDSHAVLTLVF